MSSGREKFLEQGLRRVPALVITEEAPSLWAGRLAEFPADSAISFVSRPFLGRPTPEQWRKYVAVAAGWSGRHQIGLVVIDPIANLIPGDENYSGAMLDFLLPLAAFTRQGSAVLLLHHPRKSDGSEGRAARGSGALPGFVDIVLEMRREDRDPQNRIRVLTGLSRFAETPLALCLNLAPDGINYRVLHSQHTPEPKLDQASAAWQAPESHVERMIERILTDAAEALTARQIHERWPTDVRPPRFTSVLRTLKDGLNLRWTRTGLGTRVNQFRYLLLRAG
jgi:AAA domain